jgi:hypothetical protein
VLDKRQLQYYRVLGEMPVVEADPNLHAAAHLYASDRNGLFPVNIQLVLGWRCEANERPRSPTSSASATTIAPSPA